MGQEAREAVYDGGDKNALVTAVMVTVEVVTEVTVTAMVVAFVTVVALVVMVAVARLVGRWLAGLGHTVMDLGDPEVQEELVATPEVGGSTG